MSIETYNNNNKNKKKKKDLLCIRQDMNHRTFENLTRRSNSNSYSSPHHTLSPRHLILLLLFVCVSSATQMTSSSTVATTTPVTTPQEEHPHHQQQQQENTDWVTLQARHCGMTCQNDSILVYNETCSRNIDCFLCDCDPHCDILGTCCPFYNKDTDTFHHSFESSIEKNPRQWFNRLECRHPTSTHQETFLTISKCPNTWRDREIRKNCEYPRRDSLKSVTPFSDKETGLVFLNAFCAICNGFNTHPFEQDLTIKFSFQDDFAVDDRGELYPWPLKVECRQFQTTYSLTDGFGFFHALESDSDCKFEFVAPTRKPWRPRPCEREVPIITSPLPKSPDGAEEENCTGSSFLYELCHGVPPVPALTVSGDSNMFCLFECQGRLPELSAPCPPRLILQVPIFRPDTLPAVYIASFGSPTSRDGDGQTGRGECPMGMWRTSQGNCTQVICPPGKLLRTNDDGHVTACRTAIPAVRGLGYNVQFILRATTVVNSNDFDDLTQAFRGHFARVYAESNLLITYQSRYCPIDGHDNDTEVIYRKIVEAHIKGYAIAPHDILRDDFEEGAMLFLLQTNWVLSMGARYYGTNKTVSFRLVSVGEQMSLSYRQFERNSRSFYQYMEGAAPSIPSMSSAGRIVERRQPSYSKRSPSTAASSPEQAHIDSSQSLEGHTKTQWQDRDSSPSPTSTSLSNSSPRSMYKGATAVDNSNQITDHEGNKIQTLKIIELSKFSGADTTSKEKHPRDVVRNMSPTNSFSTSPPFEQLRDLNSDRDVLTPSEESFGDTASTISVPIGSDLPVRGKGSIGNIESLLRYRSRRLSRSRRSSDRQSGGPGIPCVVEILEPQIRFIPDMHRMIFDYKRSVKMFDRMFIDITPGLRCPQIQANVTNVSKLDNGFLQFTLVLGDRETNVTYDPLDMSFEQGKLLLCLDFMEVLMAQMNEGNDFNTLVHEEDPNTPNDVDSNTEANVLQPQSSSNFPTFSLLFIIISVAMTTTMVWTCVL